MFNFLHTFQPSPVIFSLGPLNLYWYGLFIVAGFLVSLVVAVKLAKLSGLKFEIIIDLSIWLIIGGILGARLYDAALEWRYYAVNPLDVFKVWRGGLAIHGAIIGGLAALWFYVKKYQQNFWQLAAIIATALPLGQAIGRWGNYFNQELFGLPTNSPWGIPIEQAHRPWLYLNNEYFHPTFLYESLGNLAIFLILFAAYYYLIKNNKFNRRVYSLLITFYLLFYSLLRFFTEYIRIDSTPTFLGLRFPQAVSLLVVIGCLIYLVIDLSRKISEKIRA